jgi:trehalose 6-phosphate phosphatase
VRAELVAFEQDPGRAGAFLDFDGTLSEIVAVASDARPVAGARELLAALAAKLAVVAVVSGRSARQLVEWLGPDTEIWGVYGAQRSVGERVELTDALRPHAEDMARVRAEAARAVAEAGLDSVVVEDKEVVVTLHWRAVAPADRTRVAHVVAGIARGLAERYGLVEDGTRFSRELRPPVELSKAAVVLGRARERALEAVMFVGDDTVDLAAFDALDELASEGVAAVRVAVRSDDSPPELIRRADVVVEGPGGVLELLSELV